MLFPFSAFDGLILIFLIYESGAFLGFFLFSFSFFARRDFVVSRFLIGEAVSVEGG